MVSELAAAVSGFLLDDVESLAAALAGAGWKRGIHGGQWIRVGAPAWSAFSLPRPPCVSFFFTDDDAEAVLLTARRIACRIDESAGLEPAGVRPGWITGSLDEWRTADEDDPSMDEASWVGGPVRISLFPQPGRRRGRVQMPPDLQLAIERRDAPADGLPRDDDHSRRVAETGSPIARWHLAGDDALPDDVVDRLAGDDDPAVVAALAANARQRRHASERAGAPLDPA